MLGLQLLIALGLMAAVGQGLWSATKSNGIQHGTSSADSGEHDQHKSALAAPNEIAGLKLVQAASGEEAMQAINHLHGLDVGIIEAWVGQYQKGAVVWIGVAKDVIQAQELTAKMTKGILNGNTGFKHLSQQQLEGLTIHQLSSADQLHFYYQKANKVIWIAAPPSNEDIFLHQAIQAIP